MGKRGIKPTQEKEITFEYPDEESRVGKYSDVVRIAFSSYTVSFELAQLIPPDNSNNNKARIVDRIIMSPGHAKAFYEVLGENLKKYESHFGEITTYEKVEEGDD